MLRAMIETGATLGYAESSVEAVVAAAGVSRSTFYAHFRDLDACFLAALDLLSEAAVAAAGEAGRAGGTAAAIRALVEFAEQEPAGARLLFVQSLAGKESALNRRERLREQIEGALAGPGRVDVPPTSLSTVIGGVLRLLAMRLRRAAPDLPALGNDLATWIDLYDPGGTSLPLPSPGGVPTEAQQTPKPTRNKRLRILQATAACSYERGYHAVRVADITARARVSRKAFYRQFGNKAEAATEANETLFHAALGACAGSFFGSDGWPDRVWAGGSALIAFLAAHPVEAHLGFVETHAIGSEAARHVYDRLEAFTLFLEEGYRYRPEAGALPRSISEALAAAMFELAFRNLRERGDLAQLLRSLPLLTHTILVPFMGADAATEFVEKKTLKHKAPGGMGSA